MQSMNEKKVASSELLNLPLLRNTSHVFMEKITSEAHFVKANKGKVLFVKGDHAERFYYIKSGWVKLYRETIDGDQAVIDIITCGQIFGKSALFENFTYTYSAEVVEATEIISFPLLAFKTELENNHKFAIDFIKNLKDERQQIGKELEHKTLQNASQRIGCFLLRLTNKTVEGKTIIHLPYDKALLALRLGMQPETFSRALSKLKEVTNLSIKGATIEVNDIKVLSDYCCKACSSVYPCKKKQ